MIATMVPCVLVVDDDLGFLVQATRILEAIGVERVLTAPNAAAGFVEAVEHRPWAILVDVGLPDRNGTDLAQELAALAWSPRVVLTSSDNQAVIGADPVAGAARLAFVPKEDLAESKLHHLLSTS